MTRRSDSGAATFGYFVAAAATAGAIALRIALDPLLGAGSALTFVLFGLVAAGSAHAGLTARRRREQVLAAAHDSEQRYAAVFDTSPFPLALIRMPRGTVIEVNDAWLRLFGYRRDEVLGRTTIELGITPSPAYAAMAWELGERGLVRDFECVRRTAASDGAQTLAVSMDRVRLAGGRHVLTTIRDITEQRRAEDALRESDRRRDEFLAVLAHELRNPLAPIRTGVELLRVSGGTPGTVARVQPVLERQVAHMVRLIDDLLDISRISSDRIQLQREPTLLTTLIDCAVEANRAAIDAAGLQLSVSVTGRPLVLDVDPIRIVQVLSNVLHNAVKFTPRGGWIGVEASAPEAMPLMAVVRISDTGRGIAPALLPRVFERFVHGPRDGRGSNGLGVGLALARQLVDMHRGRIEATSTGEGHGSTFTIHLPATEATAAVDHQPPVTPGAEVRSER